MPKLKTLSGRDLLRIFATIGFEVVSQRGSHLKLRRTLPSNVHQSLTIPMHREVATGSGNISSSSSIYCRR